MKITLTGSTGNITKPLAKQLISAGHQVTIISSNADKTADIKALGATPAIGSVTDVAFLTAAFTGAEVVYTMVPPNVAVSDMIGHMSGIGQNYATAIRAAGIPRVVNLSSMGAHLDPSPGPIAGSRAVEGILNQLENVAIKHLRPPFFFTNFLNSIGMIRQLGIMGSTYPANTKLVLVHYEDLADAAAEEIQQGFTGKSIRYVASDERTTGEVAAVLGAAVGKPELPWVEFSDDQALQGMLQGGFSEGVAGLFINLGAAVRKQTVWEDYSAGKTGPLGSRKLETFAKEFSDKFTLAS